MVEKPNRKPALSLKRRQMETLRTRRTVLIEQIKRCSDFVSKAQQSPASASIPEMKLRYTALDEVFSNFQKVQLKIEELDPNEVKTSVRSDNEESYFSSSSSLQVMLNAAESPPLDTSTANSTEIRFDPIRLHEIKLPIFTGEITTWMSWFETFSSLVHNNVHLSKLSKFHHLVSSLADAAKAPIDGLKIIEDNYDEAIKKLKERFENKRVIAQEHLHHIFNLPKIIKPTPVELRNLMDKSNNHLTSLRNLKRPVDQWDDLIVYLLTSKLDTVTANRWNETSPVDRLPTINEFNAFITKRCQILEGNILNQSLTNNSACKIPNSTTKPQRNTPKSLIATTVPKIKCLFCSKSGHFIYKCFKLLNLPITDRYQSIKKLNLCENCLKTDQHSSNQCNANGCHTCGQRHHTLLHIDNSLNDKPVPGPTTTIAPKNYQLNSNAAIYAPSCSPVVEEGKITLTSTSLSDGVCSTSETLLATALINVFDSIDQLIPCRILLDSGSQLNLVSERFFHMLGLRRSKFTQVISGVAQNVCSSQYKGSVVISSRLTDFKKSIEVIILKKLTNCIPESNIDISDWKIPKNIELSDPLFHKSQKIDMVLGAEVFFELLSIGQIKLGMNLPLLQKTMLGWVVAGPYQYQQAQMTSNCFAYTAQEADDDFNLHEDLKMFWEIENGSDSFDGSKILKKSEQDCEEHYNFNFCRLEDGRYQVRLPFKETASNLGESFTQALKRFNTLERRFRKNSGLREDYAAVVNEFLTLNHMELATDVDFTQPHFFLPHHCVLKPSSSTTKMRVVFDGSAKTSTGISLNDALLIGPVVQNDLFSILVRFRLFAYVFTADISKMYRQVSMHPADRRFQMILWRNNESESLKIYQLSTVTYGTAPASYLATKTLQRLSLDEGRDLPMAANSVNMDFYVDDLLTGASTLEDALQLKSEIIQLLSRGGFALRKWCSNDNRILEDIPENDKETQCRISNSSAIKTLSTYWNPTSDKFLFDCSEGEYKAITKKTVLSEIAKLFDPLGLINPIIVLAKVFMQELWRLGLKWDESLPMEHHQRWIRFRKELKHIDKFQFDRRVFFHTKRNQLHAFSDSSEYAYGTCLYVRSLKEDGSISVKLLCSKSRVAPIKKISIPRLELCAAVLMVRFVDKIQHIFKGEIESVFYWTDSSIVLSWISEESSNFETFVANRVSVIQNLSKSSQWRHVRSKLNPADIISRGAYPLDLHKSDLWFFGPTYLKSPESDWPNSALSNVETVDKNLLERRKHKVILSVTSHKPYLKTIKCHNNYLATLRYVALLLRYPYNAKAKSLGLALNLGEITPVELERALRNIIWTMQQEYFAFELQLLHDKKPLPGRSHLLSLHPFIDDENLIRVGGRISNAEVNYDAKHPILLPKDHFFTEVIVRHYHNRHMHVGPQTLLSIIREKFWPIHGKVICTRVCRQCIRCLRCQPPPLETVRMGDLPKSRVQQCRPFLKVGVDFCGPFSIHFRRRGTAPVKGYVAIFVCFSTRAVHLEVVEDLSTVAFLAALKRFIGRRGYPSIIYSDNATNFKGARNELSAVYEMLNKNETQNQIIRHCAVENITWKTIPPRSPHFGGLWEAAVKSAKFHMKRVLQTASLTFQELNTVIIQIESVLNSRPITPLSTNPSDLNALTPAHFIIGSPLTCLAEPDITESNSIGALTRYQLLQWYFQTFWKRWSREYLQTLQARTKWKKSGPNFKIDDIVLIADENLSPLNWKLGRIVQTHPGKDGIIRAATVKTSTGIKQRAIMKLRRLPLFEGSSTPQGGVDVH